MVLIRKDDINLDGNESGESNFRIAVLIDAENVSSDHIKKILEEITRYGTPTIKRSYGDWTNPQHNNWKKAMLHNAITPIQQYSYTSGKNSTDSALIIDAMDILYTRQVEGFCLVSSDSDFTRLATRLRETGKWVIGIGEKKTPNPFIVACDKFVYIEVIDAVNNITPLGKDSNEELIKLISSSILDTADENGYAFLADVGNSMLKKQPDFDSRNYGYAKLTPLIKKLDHFVIDERVIDGLIKHVYIKIK